MKLGPHGIRTTPQGLAWARAAPVVKVVDNTALLHEARPDAVRVFRHFFREQRFDMRPEDVAAEILAALGTFRHPQLYVEVYNEVPRQQTAEYAALLARVVPILHANGVKVAGPSWATGDYDAEHWELMRSRSWCGLDAIAVHCYWANHGLTPWNALRYRQFWRPGDPPVIVTECGRDRVRDAPGGGYSGNGGWQRDGIPAEQYVAELVAYNTELAKDPYVLGAVVFTCGPTDDWRAFDTDPISAQLMQRLPPPQLSAPPPASAPKEQPPMTVRYYDTSVQPRQIAEIGGVKVYDIRARYPEVGGRYDRRNLATITNYIVHHSAGSQATDLASALRQGDVIQRFHISDPEHRWPAIGYHLLGAPGVVLWVNGFDVVSYHTADQNERGVSLCLLGTFEQTPLEPWMASVIRAGWMFTEQQTRRELALWGHAEIAPSSTDYCPSRNWRQWKGEILKMPIDEKKVAANEAAIRQHLDVVWGYGQEVLDLGKALESRKLEEAGRAVHERVVALKRDIGLE